MEFINFLLGVGVDGRGRTLADYKAFNSFMWEECHDHIQWAFPTKTPSAYNPNAPVIPDDFVFDGDYRVKQAILDLMTEYMKSLHITIAPADSGRNFVKFIYEPETEYQLHWVNWRDHNMKRLTRLIECLGIFDLKEVQRDLFEFLVYEIAVRYRPRLSSVTVAYWVAAWENKGHLLRL